VSAAVTAAIELHDTLELHEADITIPEGGDEHIVEVTLIRSGRSKMGNHYPSDVLAAAVPLFEGAPAFADHQKRPHLPEGSVRDIVGYYANVRALQEAGTTALRAQLHLLPGTGWLFHLLEAAQRNPRLCGISIDAWAERDDRRSTRESQHISGIQRVNSADIVTRPSAGGAVRRVLQSDRSLPAGGSPATTILPQERTMTADSTIIDPTIPTDGAAPSPAHGDAAIAGHRQEAETSDLAAVVEQLRQERAAACTELNRLREALAPGQPRPADPQTDLTRLVEEIRRDRDLARAEGVLAARLQEAALPAPVADKLRRQFSGRVVDAAVIEAAIADEKAVLAALTSSGEIRGMGHERTITMGMDEYEQLQTAFDQLFDVEESDAAKSVPRLSGIREAFLVATGRDIGSIGGCDHLLRESIAAGLRSHVRGAHLTEAEALLREADVTTASFSALLGTSMNKRLLKDYQAWPSEWQKFTTIVAIKDFKAQTRVRLGAFGSLSTVAEDAAYTTLTLADTSATYTPAKRGNLVQITRETIINDDLYAIKQIPQKLAVAAAFTLAEFVYNLLAPNGGNIYDAHPLFDSVNHANTGVIAANLNTANSGVALTSGNLQTAIVKMRKQQNMASKPIGLKPRYLLVPPDLEFTAMTILRSAGLPGGNNNDINPMMGYAEPIVAPQLNNLASGPASTSVWIAVADPRVIDTLEVGFVGGQANPVLLIQDMPLYGLNFTQDTISYKVRHEYGGAVVDYRGFYLGNN
jgi:phage major head subunit gpT-like protein